MQTINKYGDHATCCAKSGDLIIRHNSMRNFVCSVAADGKQNPILEKQGILGPTSGRRPGDVTIPCWSEGNGLAIDLAVTCPLIASSVRLENPANEYARAQKHGKYDKQFEGTNYFFCAMVFETLGAINDEGEEVLRELFRFAAKQLGHEFSSYCGRAWARVSCCLQRSVAQVILNRIDGHKAPSASAPEVPLFEFQDPEEPFEFQPAPATSFKLPPEIPPCPFLSSVQRAPVGHRPGSNLEEKKRDKSEREMSAVREEVGGEKKSEMSEKSEIDEKQEESVCVGCRLSVCRVHANKYNNHKYKYKYNNYNNNNHNNKTINTNSNRTKRVAGPAGLYK
jgi:hypothetical protein